MSLSLKLIQALGNYGRVAKMKACHEPAFKDCAYLVRSWLLSPGLPARAAGGAMCSVPITCAARDCHEVKKADFCFQCAEFPCDREFDDFLRKGWQVNNERMKESGVVKYYEEIKKMPRY